MSNRKTYLARGDCGGCGRRPPVSGRKTCQECLDQAKAAYHRKRAALTPGKSWCSCNCEKEDPTLRNCSVCRARWSRRTKARRTRKRTVCVDCLEKTAVEGRVRCEECLESNRVVARRFWKRLKEQVFDSYGGRFCRCCGEKEMKFLTIDHINGGGCRHLKELARSGTTLYNWLKKNKFPDGFRVLCFNCNSGRKLGPCPHEEKQKTMFTVLAKLPLTY